MKLREMMSTYSGNACISIEGYCEEKNYDYYLIPQDEFGNPDEDIFSGDNPNHYIPNCLEKEPWWKEVEDSEVVRWCIIGGGINNLELCIYLKSEGGTTNACN